MVTSGIASQMQVIRNVELENALLRTELSLYQREENIKELELRNDRLVTFSHQGGLCISTPTWHSHSQLALLN